LVSVSESFAESVDFIDRDTFTSANVDVEVTQASVLVQLSDGALEVTGESSKGAVSDEAEDLSIDAVLVSDGDGHEGGCNEFSDHFV